MKQSMRFAAIGAAIGAVGGVGVSWILLTQIPGIPLFDARAFGLAATVVFAAAAFAAWMPAKRASKIEPVITLRCD